MENRDTDDIGPGADVHDRVAELIGEFSGLGVAAE